MHFWSLESMASSGGQHLGTDWERLRLTRLRLLRGIRAESDATMEVTLDTEVRFVVEVTLALVDTFETVVTFKTEVAVNLKGINVRSAE